MATSLVILAAGLASRYGSDKQIEGFGLNNELILEFSIYDAIYAGFDEVIFVIRPELHNYLKENIEPKIVSKIKVQYIYQLIDSFTNGYSYTKDRIKPWGTAHAVLCCKNAINNPFAVINADDFYGRDSFVKAYQFLQNINEQSLSIIGYELSKTLSDHGSVSRGICEIGDQNNLLSVTERLKIYKKQDDNIVYFENDEEFTIPKNTLVSMNFFCLHHSFFEIAEKEFHHFLSHSNLELKKEFYLPLVVNKMIKNHNYKCLLIPCSAQWYGVTYKEDALFLRTGIKKMIEKKEYPDKL